MQQVQREKPDNPIDNARRAYNVLLQVAFIWSTPVQMLMRKVGTMGRRYPLQWQFITGMFVMFGFEAALNPVGDHAPMVLAASLTGALMVLHWVKRPKAVKQHTLYCGDSGLGNHKLAYTVFEPAVAMLAGVGCLYLSPALGIYLIGAAVSSSLFFAHLDSRDAARLRAMSDAEHEQRAYMATYRQERES